MALISPKEAVNSGFASRANLYKKIADSTLSVTKTPDNKTLIETADLIRVFGEPSLKRLDAEKTQHALGQEKSSTETLILRERLDGVMREKESLEKQLAESKERESWLKSQVEKQQQLLTSSQHISLWNRLFR